jgi:hypothetical protein
MGSPIRPTRCDPHDAQRRSGRGMVTAEFAVATLAALAVLTMLCWAIFLVVMQMRCIDTAGEVARQAARGDKAAVQRAERDAPHGAHVRVRTSKGVTSVQVRLTARPFAQWLVPVALHAEAQVDAEPGVGGAR